MSATDRTPSSSSSRFRRTWSPTAPFSLWGARSGAGRFTLLEGRLRYIHNLQGQTLYEVVSEKVLGPGRHQVEFRFDKDEVAGGHATLLQDGELVGTGAVDRFTPNAFNEVGIGLTCGYEWGPAVGGDYQAPFPFSGTIIRAEVVGHGTGRPRSGGRGGGDSGLAVTGRSIWSGRNLARSATGR